ncbi:MAG: ArnT family glycosyltransferase, partial [Candidatus Promineifilaceae bacterium]
MAVSRAGMFAHPYTAPQPGAGRRDRRPLVILGLILALAVGLRLGAADGRWLWLDSFRYVQAARALNEAGMGPYLAQIDSPHADRLAIVLPLAAAIRLLGLSELALIGLPLLLAAGTVVAAFALGRLVSPATGLITALLTAGLPLDVGYSLPILPDSFLPFYGAMALLCFLLGLRRRSWWLYLLSGFFVFCAYESRATGALLLAPFMALAFLWPRRHWPAAIVPLLAFLGLLAAAAAAAWWATGDPLAQFRWNAAVATAPEWAGTGRPLEHLKNMLAPGAWLSHDFAWFYYLAFAAALVAAFRLRRRPKAYLPPLLAFATLYLYFEFGSTSLTAYLP